jgi:cell division protein FtsB
VPVIARPTSNRRKLMLAALGLGLLALAVHTLFSEHGYLALRKQEQEIDRLEKEIQRLEKENERLAEEVRTLKTDPRAVERVAREELKMARPGEKVIILPERAADSKSDEEKQP